MENPMTVDALSFADEWGPEKIVTVYDSKSGMRGVLVIDNTARGMGKGGTRMSATVTTREIARLARVMTWKWATADLFFGGAKAGIAADPASPDKERIIRAFARALRNEVPSEYVFGLDMGLTERDAAIIQDELGDRGAAVGAPDALGGIPYDELGVTGFGVAEASDAAMAAARLELADSRVVVQGFGAVGKAACRRFHTQGATVIAVSTARGALHADDGLDIPRLIEASERRGDDFVLDDEIPARHLPSGAELLLPTDLLIPAATQDVIDAQLAAQIDARCVVEAANLPTTPDAQDVLDSRGIVVVPDFVANAGGVVAAAFAMDARYSPFRPDPDNVLSFVSTTLRANTTRVLEEAHRRKVTTHAAGRASAARRVREAMILRGKWTANA
jgi:glutamate dehydrogenase (NAD(P)+)